MRDTADPTANDLILSGGLLIDGTGAAPLERSWIHVRGGRIAAVGQGSPPEVSSATAIDTSGHSVLPGLSDMHVHIGHGTLARSKWVLKLLLAHGVTRLKDAGGPLGKLAAVRRWLDLDEVNPRLRISGVTLNGAENELRFLREGRDTQLLLENNLAFGVEFLKIHNWVSSGAMRQITAFAREHDILLTGHVPLSMTSVEAISQGLTILEHVRAHPGEVHDDPAYVGRFPLDLRVMRRTAHWARFDPDSRAVTRTLESWQAHRDRIFLDPTIVVQNVVSNVGERTRSDGPRIDHLSPAIQAIVQTAGSPYIDPLTDDEITELQDSVAGMTAFTGLAHRAGIRILTGTDTVDGLVAPGASLIREIEYLVEAGLSPVEAIHASTGQAAAAFRAPDEGTIRAGARADLVIARGDVARDIRALNDIEQVMLGGRLHHRADLLAAADALARNDQPAVPGGAPAKAG